MKVIFIIIHSSLLWYLYLLRRVRAKRFLVFFLLLWLFIDFFFFLILEIIISLQGMLSYHLHYSYIHQWMLPAYKITILFTNYSESLSISNSSTTEEMSLLIKKETGNISHIAGTKENFKNRNIYWEKEILKQIYK